MTNRRIVANYPPITHGHWVMMLDSYTQRAPKHGWFCSECREIIIKKGRKRLPKYCEECGTKMDEYEPGNKDEENHLLTMDEVRSQRLVWAEYKERPTDKAKLLLICWLKR